eukprot:TRINITY_DN805_c0_g1_i3.p1 TRINITY_DN805_c0_g1~~TRINITY_DN805_c0_g1_i3.p1  ORF type:complete len:196 (-),score=61.59 TRINITY_DN805_c0_g1_i3:271-828(-)
MGAAALGQTQAVFIQYSVVELGKHLVARYRPDYLDRCGELDANGNCKNTGHVVEDGNKSFPSGHSSTIFSGMVFFSMWLSGKLGVFSGTIRSFHSLLAAFVPWIIAFLVAISRTIDYHHNFDDILAGSIIGIFAAYVTYYLHYPSLSASNPGQPLFREDTPPSPAEKRASLSFVAVDPDEEDPFI